MTTAFLVTIADRRRLAGAPALWMRRIFAGPFVALGGGLALADR
jgi:hypothetical protein